MKLILDIVELQIKSKKKVLGVCISYFKTYTRHSGIVVKSKQKKKVFVGDYLFKLFKGGDSKNEFRKP